MSDDDQVQVEEERKSHELSLKSNKSKGRENLNDSKMKRNCMDSGD